VTGWRGPDAELSETGLDFPTLGITAWQWIEANCVVPDGDLLGEPFRLTDEMVRFLVHFYRINPIGKSLKWGAPRFHYERGAQLVRPQKWGKGPFSAAIILFEACGPALPDGWDANGVAVGRPWPTPHIQITAISEDQTANVYRALTPMIRYGPLDAELPDTGLTRVNLPGGGLIEPVTASAMSRLGQRVTHVLSDETHGWIERNGGKRLADNQRRNLSGMGGRFLETTNAWSITDDSVAQDTNENPVGVFVDYPAPIGGSVRNRSERRKAMRHAYGDSVRNGPTWRGWVDLDRVDVEVEALMKRDPAQAERFFLNRVHAGEDVAFDLDAWRTNTKADHVVADGSLIAIGVDGARWEDALAIIATEVSTFHQWPLCIIEKPPGAGPDYEHDFELADAAVDAAVERYEVGLIYSDPQKIEHLTDRWEGRYGKDRVADFVTNLRSRKLGDAVAYYVAAVAAGDMSHDGDGVMARHIANARRKLLPALDDDGRNLFTLTKDRPHSPNKIDGAMAGVISSEARRDCIAKGLLDRKPRRAWFAGV
jgi:hypothetical protein